MRPALTVHRHIRHQYACKNCETIKELVNRWFRAGWKTGAYNIVERQEVFTFDQKLNLFMQWTNQSSDPL